jgi:hypothetical protein
MLAQRSGAENIPIGSPGKDRFKSAIVSPRRRAPPFALKAKESTGLPAESMQKEINNSRVETTSVATKPSPLEPVLLPDWSNKALPRRTDWTPTKDDDTSALIDLGSPQPAAPPTLAASYSFRATELGSANLCRAEIVHGPTKRRKIDLVESAAPSNVASSSKSSARAKPRAKSATTKNLKSAPKKAKTITDLVTAHHSSRSKPASATADFLVATQAEPETRQATEGDGKIEVGIRSSKAKDTKRGRRTKLLSPNSAVKAFERQETIFGSASQLLKDEAIVTVVLSSDPISPPRTQAMSVESTTPAKSYFVGRRNLWGAADRDEDNALLQLDAVDLLDTPAAHPASKPTVSATHLVQPTTYDSPLELDAGPANDTPTLTAVRTTAMSQIVDIDDFSSPAAIVPAAHRPGCDNELDSGVARSNPSKTQLEKLPRVSGPPENDGISSRKSVQAPGRDKPNYMGMHTTELQKVIKGYGFKAIKSRGKMIDLLNKCWTEQEARRLAKTQAPEPTQNEPLKHSEIISNVHDLSSRPMPKPKGKRARKSNASTSDAAPKPEASKTPKKKAATNTKADEMPKKPRARKVKTDVPDEKPSSSHIIKEAGSMTVHTIVNKANDQMAEVVPTMPPLTQTAAKQWSDTTVARESAENATDTLDHPDIGEQVHAAVLFQSETAAQDSDRDHVREPTWHERILMYDPIVIEDLARWLNAEGLNNIHEDREVTLIEVRDWCESKGICCMWKGGWRGQASKGASD